MSLLDDKVWVIREQKPVEVVLRDLSKYIETTTRPHGVGTKFYVTQDSEGRWALAYWVTYGGPERIVEVFDTESDATTAAEKLWVQDIWNNDDEVVFATEEAAKACLAEMIEDGSI